MLIQAKLWIKRILLRIVYRLCDFNVHDLLLASEISAWQDIYDKKAPTVYPRPLYPQKM